MYLVVQFLCDACIYYIRLIHCGYPRELEDELRVKDLRTSGVT